MAIHALETGKKITKLVHQDELEDNYPAGVNLLDSYNLQNINLEANEWITGNGPTNDAEKIQISIVDI